MIEKRAVSFKYAPKARLNGSFFQTTFKEFLTASNFTSNQNQHLATKIFEIHFPEPCKKPKANTKCGDSSREKAVAQQITCKTEESCMATKRKFCHLDFIPVPRVRRPPPFPAFSDCLDEEMEDILTECPLDKEKFHRMQPSHVYRRPELAVSPPPIQGKLDLLKEQECLREKLQLEKEGLTQTCDNFGKPVPLMKSKDIIKEKNEDCAREALLKTQKGRWPPWTLKSNRRFSTLSCSFVRHYHALTKKVSKPKKNLKLEEIMIPKQKKEKEENIVLKESKKAGRNYSTYSKRKCIKRRFSNNSGLMLKSPFSKLKRSFKGKGSGSKFTLNSCPPRGKVKCRKSECGKSSNPYPAFSDSKKQKSGYECSYGLEKMASLQPRFAILSGSIPTVNEYPNQERIDRSLGIEYYKCKHGFDDTGGQTIGCEEYFKEKNSKQTVIECLVQNHKNETSDNVNCCSQTPKDPCESDKNKLEDLCMSECLKSVPCTLPEEEKYCICQARCKKLFQYVKEQPKVCSSFSTPIVPIPSSNVIKPDNCIKPKIVKCSKVPSPCKMVAVKPPNCDNKNEQPKSVSQWEWFWQKVVNYFKARPNCPQPGEYKIKSLKVKAEKAANAAGLVVVDPKCLPPDMLRSFKADSNCKICPDNSVASKSGCPKPQSKNFSTNYQSSRSYSNNCKNLEEINKLLEEAAISKSRRNRTKPTVNTDILPNLKNPNVCQALKMSIDLQLHKSVNLKELITKNRYSSTYFGYSDIIPSRENILERAWRRSIEAYNKCNNYSKNHKLFNELFNKTDNSIKAFEDLEKLKTETVLRELDQLLEDEADFEETTKKKK